jgi:hypothetical protein
MHAGSRTYRQLLQLHLAVGLARGVVVALDFVELAGGFVHNLVQVGRQVLRLHHAGAEPLLCQLMVVVVVVAAVVVGEPIDCRNVQRACAHVRVCAWLVADGEQCSVLRRQRRVGES